MAIKKKPKIIIWDLETLPDWKEVLKNYAGLSNYWGLTLKAQITSIIVFGHKELGQKKAKAVNVWDFKGWQKNINDDKKLCIAAYNVLKDADAIVTYNGKSFDWPHLQTRLMKHGLDPLHRIIHIDCKNIAKQNLSLFNNKLQNVGKFLVNEKKKNHEGWDMWVKVHDHDPKAMKHMTAYCKQDVNLLEKVFLKLRPFITNLPNANLYIDSALPVCPKCGSASIHKNGTRPQRTGFYQMFRCKECLSPFQKGIKQKYPQAF